jgi:SAM-dependent methyltransferase
MKSTTPVFNSYSRYYDLLYKDKDYVAEADYIQALLIRHGVNSGCLLDLGSGTGIHGCLLASRGYNVLGIERSAEMAKRAAIVDGFTSQQGDIRSIKLGQTFDAILSIFHVISYQIENADLTAVFTKASEHLQPGGVFIFDFWYSPAVYSQQPSVRVKRMTDTKIEITRLAEPVIFSNQNRVDVNYTIFARNLISDSVEITTEIHSMRHFSLPEIDILAVKTGFERIDTEEFLSGKPASDSTWGVCVVLKRI